MSRSQKHVTSLSPAICEAKVLVATALVMGVLIAGAGVFFFSQATWGRYNPLSFDGLILAVVSFVSGAVTIACCSLFFTEPRPGRVATLAVSYLNLVLCGLGFFFFVQNPDWRRSHVGLVMVCVPWLFLNILLAIFMHHPAVAAKCQGREHGGVMGSGISVEPSVLKSRPLTTLFVRALSAVFFCVGLAGLFLGAWLVHTTADGGRYSGVGRLFGLWFLAIGGANTVCTLLYFIYPKVGKYLLVALALLNLLFLLLSYEVL